MVRSFARTDSGIAPAVTVAARCEEPAVSADRDARLVGNRDRRAVLARCERVRSGEGDVGRDIRRDHERRLPASGRLQAQVGERDVRVALHDAAHRSRRVRARKRHVARERQPRACAIVAPSRPRDLNADFIVADEHAGMEELARLGRRAVHNGPERNAASRKIVRTVRKPDVDLAVLVGVDAVRTVVGGKPSDCNLRASRQVGYRDAMHRFGFV